MPAKSLINEIDYTKSLMGIKDFLILEDLRTNLPQEIKDALTKLEKNYGVKILDSNIEAEKNQEKVNFYEDNGGLDSSATSDLKKFLEKLYLQFPRAPKPTNSNCGNILGCQSGYRGYLTQVDVFGGKISDGNVLRRQKVSALPGFSQHHTGKAFDIISLDNSFWDSNPQIKNWVEDNAVNFNFKISYPTQGTLRSSEPWHIFHIGGGDGPEELGATDMQTFKSLLTSLGYEYKKTMDEAGPLKPEFVASLKSVAVSLKKGVPEYRFRFGAGRDFWHQKRKGSRHNRGQAVDVTLVGKSPKKEDLDKISTVLCAARQKLRGFTFIDEYTCPSAGATGGHYHLSWDPSGSDESSCTPRFCSSDKTKTDITNVSVPKPKDVATKPLESPGDFDSSEVKQPDKVEKILDTIGLSRLAKMDLDKDGKQFSKEVVDLFGGDEDDVKETEDGDFKIFGYTLSDIINKAKKLFEQRLHEDIQKMKKPLK